MSINLGIIDQRVRKLAEDLAPEFAARLNLKNDENKLRSVAFVLLVVQTTLFLPREDALECLTEGGNDFGIDAIHLSDVEDGEFIVTLFQGKYKHDLSGESGFPQSGIEKMVQAVRYLFDPNSVLTVNPALARRMEEIRSLVRDGLIPGVRVILCNNGVKWNDVAQEVIDRSGFPKNQVSWEYANHDDVVRLLQAVKPVNDTLRLAGKAIVEDFDYCRVLVGKMPVREVAELFNRHGDLLLERNVRRFLGLSGNRVNQAISATLSNHKESPQFYFYNNGITIVCHKFAYNALQSDNFQVRVDGLQVINGGQTCKTIQQTLANEARQPRLRPFLAELEASLEKAFVLVRVYELPTGSDPLVHSITYATNSQNPVDLRDLKSNDPAQVSLETAIGALGYRYHRHRAGGVLKSNDISSATAAEAILSVWRQRPHQAKFQSREHFGKLYDLIFSPTLNAAQVIIAALIYRFAENKRRRPPTNTPDFVAYGSCFLAMRMGKHLLTDLNITMEELNHRDFDAANALWNAKSETYFDQAVIDVDAALKKLYGGQKISLQRLSATFRRGDLIEELA